MHATGRSDVCSFFLFASRINHGNIHGGHACHLTIPSDLTDGGDGGDEDERR